MCSLETWFLNLYTHKTNKNHTVKQRTNLTVDISSFLWKKEGEIEEKMIVTRLDSFINNYLLSNCV